MIEDMKTYRKEQEKLAFKLTPNERADLALRAIETVMGGVEGVRDSRKTIEMLYALQTAAHLLGAE